MTKKTRRLKKVRTPDGPGPVHIKGPGVITEEDLDFIDHEDYEDEGFRNIVAKFLHMAKNGCDSRDDFRVAKNLMRIAKNLYKRGRTDTARSYAKRSIKVLESTVAS